MQETTETCPQCQRASACRAPVDHGAKFNIWCSACPKVCISRLALKRWDYSDDALQSELKEIVEEAPEGMMAMVTWRAMQQGESHRRLHRQYVDRDLFSD